MRSAYFLAGFLCLTGCSDGVGEQSANVEDATDRATWVRAELTQRNAWLSDDVRALKYGKMSESPFSFYRGSNHLFWADHARDERLETFAVRTWVQGDLHVNNYGAFHDDIGRIIYDLNDFDEAIVADYQIDLWRAAVSLVLVAQEQQLEEQAEDSVLAFVESYLDTVETYRGNDDEQKHVVDADNAYGRLDEFLEDVAGDESRVKMLDKWTTLVDGVRTLNTEYKKLAVVGDALDADIRAAMPGYGQTLSGKLDYDDAYFAVKSVAHRLNAGVGSLGVARYYLLIEGPSADQNDDVILDVKMTLRPTGLEYDGTLDYPFQSDARRSVIAQKAMGTGVDDHLGWLSLDDDFAVRERSPFKETFPTTELTSEKRLRKLAEQWGAVLATAHARADEDFDDAYVPYSFDKQLFKATDGQHDEVGALVLDVARAYAEQVTFDYQAFLPLVP
jgi:uncharacterized protein (DUF2252 family)